MDYNGFPPLITNKDEFGDASHNTGRHHIVKGPISNDELLCGRYVIEVKNNLSILYENDLDKNNLPKQICEICLERFLERH
jgi:hypothetical protein